MFYVLAILPASVTLTLLIVVVSTRRQRYRVFWFAAIGCLIAAAAPWYAMWHAWFVLNDHTANIGAGLLALGQPLLAPIGAMLGALVGMAFEAVSGGKVRTTRIESDSRS